MVAGASTQTINIDELLSDHEEADTRLILHAAHCNNEQVVIWSPDTDVAIIAVTHTEELKKQM